MRRFLAATALAAFPAIALGAPRGLTAEDLVSLARISEPALSPDGRRVVYTVRETDIEADRGRTDLWLLEFGGGLTNLVARATAPLARRGPQGDVDGEGSEDGASSLAPGSGVASPATASISNPM